jgi:SUKH-4 immunity protein
VAGAAGGVITRSADAVEFDQNASATAVASTLPARARWMIGGTPLDFDFSTAGHGHRSLPDEAIEPGDAAASDLLVFGEQDFAEGGGAFTWLCVRKRDGSVVGFDPELANPIFLLNSSIERFVATFRLLNEYLAENEPLPAECESRLQAIDPETYSTSDWRLLVESLRIS